jgi:hypothetical protein
MDPDARQRDARPKRCLPAEFHPNFAQSLTDFQNSFSRLAARTTS